MNKIESAFKAVRTMMLGPETPTELAVSVRRDIMAMKGYMAYLDSEKVNQLCGEFRLRTISIYDSNPIHSLIDDPNMRRRVEADGEIKLCYRVIVNKVNRYCKNGQHRNRHVSYLWMKAEESISKANLGQLPEILEQFAQALESSDLIA